MHHLYRKAKDKNIYNKLLLNDLIMVEFGQISLCNAVSKIVSKIFC